MGKQELIRNLEQTAARLSIRSKHLRSAYGELWADLKAEIDHGHEWSDEERDQLRLHADRALACWLEHGLNQQANAAMVSEGLRRLLQG